MKSTKKLIALCLAVLMLVPFVSGPTHGFLADLTSPADAGKKPEPEIVAPEPENEEPKPSEPGPVAPEGTSGTPEEDSPICTGMDGPNGWELSKFGEFRYDGQGSTMDYEPGCAPWDKEGVSESVFVIFIGEGITRIGDYAFAGCVNLTDIFLNRNIEEIGTDAIPPQAMIHAGGSAAAQAYAEQHGNPTYEFECMEHMWEEVSRTQRYPCSEIADVLYACLYCGETRSEEEYSFFENVQAHQWNEGTVIREAECTEPGQKECVCTVCGETTILAIPAKGHIEVEDPAVAPTPERNGKSAGAHCAVCGAVTVPQLPVRYGGKWTTGDYTLEMSKTDLRADVVVNSSGYASIEKPVEVDDDPFGDYQKKEYALADRNGKLLLPYSEGQNRYIVNDGVASRNFTDYIKMTESKKYGYFTLDGERMIDETYQQGKAFSDGYAFVRRGKEIPVGEPVDGYQDTRRTLNAYIIDKSGKIVLDVSRNFSDSEGIGDGYEGLSVSMVGGFGWYSEGLIGFSNARIFEKNVTEEKNGHYGYTVAGGYCDLEGNVVIPQRFAEGLPFYGGMAAVQDADVQAFHKDGPEGEYAWLEVEPKKWGYIDREGNTVIPFIYDDAKSFNGEYAVASLNGKYGVINRKGETVVPFTYDTLYNEDDGLFVCETEKGLQVKTLAGEEIFTLEKGLYTDFSEFYDGVLYFVSGGSLCRVIIEKNRTPGDIDGNGEIEVTDARYALRAAVGLENYEPDSAQFLAADTDENGEIEVSDARNILRAAVGLDHPEDWKK